MQAACALAAGGATVFRNDFVEVAGHRGQRRDHQLNNLADVESSLGPCESYFDVRNGYTFSDPRRFAGLADAVSRRDREKILGKARIGLQRGVRVTFARRFTEPAAPHHVSQAFCSALSCGYARGSLSLWEPLARLVLDAAYEATLLAAILDADEGRGTGRCGSPSSVAGPSATTAGGSRARYVVPWCGSTTTPSTCASPTIDVSMPRSSA